MTGRRKTSSLGAGSADRPTVQRHGSCADTNGAEHPYLTGTNGDSSDTSERKERNEKEPREENTGTQKQEWQRAPCILS